MTTRRIHADGDTLHAALRGGLAELLDCEEEKVELQLDAPGLDDLTGTLLLELVIGATTRDTQPTRPDHDQSERPEERPEGNGADEPDIVTPEQLDEEADAAADFLEGLLDALSLPGDLQIRVHDDHAEVEVIEIGSGALIGRRGQTLEAIQELVRCALQREFQRRSRVKIDAEGYRSRRLEKLLEKAEEAIAEVLDSGEPVRLEPMDVFERKAVHQLVADHGGVFSRSQGREPARRVVIDVDD